MRVFMNNSYVYNADKMLANSVLHVNLNAMFATNIPIKNNEFGYRKKKFKLKTGIFQITPCLKSVAFPSQLKDLQY